MAGVFLEAVRAELGMGGCQAGCSSCEIQSNEKQCPGEDRLALPSSVKHSACPDTLACYLGAWVLVLSDLCDLGGLKRSEVFKNPNLT